MMEFYTFVNIFETKGLEYLLLMCFFVLFIFLVRYLSASGRRSSESAEERSTTSGREAVVGKAAKRKPG